MCCMQIVEFVHIEQVNSDPESSELIDAGLACLQQAIREPSMKSEAELLEPLRRSFSTCRE